MRIISSSKKWDKLQQPEFTTFRYHRADKDWFVGETVQVFFKSRSPQREKLGVAEIIGRESKLLADLTHEEAIEDGFINLYDMFNWLEQAHKGKDMFTPMNKLTLRWVG